MLDLYLIPSRARTSTTFSVVVNEKDIVARWRGFVFPIDVFGASGGALVVSTAVIHVELAIAASLVPV